jgi:hypothetical protein
VTMRQNEARPGNMLSETDLESEIPRQSARLAQPHQGGTFEARSLKVNVARAAICANVPQVPEAS